MPTTLVILAAGMGSRFGGDKQLAAVGPDDATISDYLVYDALRAGFDDVVLVVRQRPNPLEEMIARRFGARLAVRCVEQRLDDIPPGAAVAPRTKPWGTAQAVMAAARDIRGAFAVVNADDLYGPAAFTALAAFLTSAASATTSALVGFPLRATLSPSGGVNRGVCRVDASGMLVGIRETINIEPHEDGGAYRDDAGTLQHLPGDTPVSMNMWAFNPAIGRALEDSFRGFLDAHGQDAKAEYLLPAEVGALVRSGGLRVRVLTGPFEWCGVTYPQDRALVADAIRRRIEHGVYPERLGA